MPDYENDNDPLSISRLMAQVLLSRNGKQADGASLRKLSRIISAHPAFNLLKTDPVAGKLAKAGRAADLCALFAQKDRQLNGPKGPYARPAFVAKDDAAFLKTASDSMKGGQATGSPAQIEREGALLQEMTKRMDQAQILLEKGIALNEKDTAELVTAVKRYNDGGTRIPGGKREARYSKQAMCVLKRYMPQEEFSEYCNKINAARGAYSPASRGYVDPKNYTNDVLTGDVRSAKELMDETRKSLSNRLTVDGCAAAAAIQKLSSGNPGALISRNQLQAEMDAYKKPGTAFMEVMNDQTAMNKLASLAANGMAGKLGSSIIEESRKHSAAAAQHQIDQAAAAAGAGRGSKQNMAELIAAKELINNSDPAMGITQDAFTARAKAIQASPAFSKMAERYDSDPGYRNRMNREIAAGDRNNAVLLEYKMNEYAPKAEKAQEPVAS